MRYARVDAHAIFRHPYRRSVCAAVTRSASVGYVPIPEGPSAASTNTQRTIPLRSVLVGLNRSSCQSALFASQIGNGSLNSPVGLMRVAKSQLSFSTFGRPYAACVVITGSAPKEIGTG